MFRGTTPTHTFTLPEQASSYAEIHITYKQCGAKVIKHAQDGVIPTGMSFNGKDVIIRLEQEETKIFNAGDFVSVQVRVLTAGGDSFASQIFKCRIDDVLNDEVLA